MFPAIASLVIIAEMLLLANVEAMPAKEKSETVASVKAMPLEPITINAYCKINELGKLVPVYYYVHRLLEDCKYLGYVQQEVKNLNEGIVCEFKFKPPKIVSTNTEIQCVNYEDKEDENTERLLNIQHKAYKQKIQYNGKNLEDWEEANKKQQLSDEADDALDEYASLHENLTHAEGVLDKLLKKGDTEIKKAKLEEEIKDVKEALDKCVHKLEMKQKEAITKGEEKKQGGGGRGRGEEEKKKQQE
ncbi:hypothetical protein niasHT_033075 [Heterodera trifolii]|uniref:Effector protein n=1 Tax=Heterodera trifolii TaxID=157864 RepID=A0ABD2IX89_9BILA